MRKLYLLLVGLLLFAATTFAQRTITGKVSDEKGNPLPNASVLVKGTTTGTTTKADGTYSLTVPASAKSLVISSVDMQLLEVSIGTQTYIASVLKEEDKSLQEVVVIGYETKKKRDIAGSISSVKGKDIAIRPVGSFARAMQGSL